jgi:hypothetical protein
MTKPAAGQDLESIDGTARQNNSPTQARERLEAAIPVFFDGEEGMEGGEQFAKDLRALLDRLKALETANAERAERIVCLYKANDSALAWIRETVSGAKAMDSTIDIIATDHDRNATLWGRTNRVIRQLRYAARRARAALGEE